jgi:hypothetical protein
VARNRENREELWAERGGVKDYGLGNVRRKRERIDEGMKG